MEKWPSRIVIKKSKKDFKYPKTKKKSITSCLYYKKIKNLGLKCFKNDFCNTKISKNIPKIFHTNKNSKLI